MPWRDRLLIQVRRGRGVEAVEELAARAMAEPDVAMQELGREAQRIPVLNREAARQALLDLALEGCLAHRLHRAAEVLVGAARERSWPVPMRSYVLLLRTLEACGEWHRAELALMSLRDGQAHPRCTASVMRACGAAGRLGHAMFHRDRFYSLQEEAGLVARVEEAALEACAACWAWKRALRLLEEARSAGLALRRGPALAMRACERAGQVDACMSLLAVHEAAGAVADAEMLVTAARACRRGRQGVEAARFARRALACEDEHGAEAVCAALDACAAEAARLADAGPDGDAQAVAQAAVALLEEGGRALSGGPRERHHRALRACMGCLVSLSGRPGVHSRVMALAASAQRLGGEAERDALESALGSCARAGDSRAALSLVAESARRGLRLPPAALSFAAAACARAGDAWGAVEVASVATEWRALTASLRAHVGDAVRGHEAAESAVGRLLAGGDNLQLAVGSLPRPASAVAAAPSSIAGEGAAKREAPAVRKGLRLLEALGRGGGARKRSGGQQMNGINHWEGGAPRRPLLRDPQHGW